MSLILYAGFIIYLMLADVELNVVFITAILVILIVIQIYFSVICGQFTDEYY